MCALAAALYASGDASVSPRDSAMRVEADRFLQGLPPDMQQRQAAAIRDAIAGDCSALQQVRQARNHPPAISPNVTAKMLNDRLCLFEPKDYTGEPLPLLVYLHGGGWTFGSINSCGRFCNELAASGLVKVLAVDYRLAPENPFPCGLNDCIEAFDYAVANSASLNIDPHRITVGGDSSGGNLAIAVALTARRDIMPHSLLLFYPVTKAFDDNSTSWRDYGVGYGLDAGIMEEFNRAYTGSGDAADTRISVGLCDGKALGQLPPTLLVAAGRDILCDQGKECAAKAAGRVRRIEFPEAVHLFITVPGQETAFRNAVALAVDFMVNDK